MQDSIPRNNDPAIGSRALFPIVPERDHAPPFADPPVQFELLESPGDEFVERIANAKALAIARTEEQLVDSSDHSGEMLTPNTSEISPSYIGNEAMNTQSTQVVLASGLATSSPEALQNQDYDPFADDPGSNNSPATNPPADGPPGGQAPPSQGASALEATQDPAFDPFSDSAPDSEKREPQDSNDFQPIPSTDPPKVESNPPQPESETTAPKPDVEENKTTSEADPPTLPQPGESNKETVMVTPKVAPAPKSTLAEWEPLLRWLIPILLLLLVAGLAWFLLRGRRRRSKNSSSHDSRVISPTKKGFVKRSKGEGTMDPGLVEETPKPGFESSELDSYLEPYDSQPPVKRVQEDEDSEFQFLEDDEIAPTKSNTQSPVAHVGETDDDDFDFSDFDEPETSQDRIAEAPIRSGVSEDDDAMEFDDAMDLLDTDEIEMKTEVENLKRPKVGLELASQLVDSEKDERDHLTIEGQSRELFERPALMDSSELDRKKGFFSRLIKGEKAELAFEDSTPTVPSTDLDQFEIAEENLSQLFEGLKPAQIQAGEDDSFGNAQLMNHPSVSANGSISDLQRSIAFLQDENIRLANRLKSAEQELDSFSEQQIQQLRELSLEQKNQLADLDRNQSELAAAREEQERLSIENSGLKTELEILRQQGNGISGGEGREQAFETLAKQLSESNAAREALEAELDSIRIEKNGLASVLEEQRIALDSTADLSVRIEELEQQLGNAQKERATAIDQISRLSASEKEWQERHHSFESALELEKSERQNLLARIDEQQLEIANSKAQVSKLQELESQLALNHQENEVLKQKLATLEHEIRQSAESNAKVGSSEIDRAVKVKFTKLYNSFEKEKRLRLEADDQLEQAEQQIASMRKLIKSLQEKLQ